VVEKYQGIGPHPLKLVYGKLENKYDGNERHFQKKHIRPVINTSVA
jgi:hypothetical protein